MRLMRIAAGAFVFPKLLATGMTFAALTLVQLPFLNLDAGYWNFFWPQFLQGMSLALVFVPLTTVTMDRTPREEMGNATSIFNPMRNLGVGFGIAAATTMIARNSQRAISRLGEQVNAYNPSARALLKAIQRGYQAGGANPATAAQRSWAAAFGLVQHQAALQAFLYTFRLLRVIFLVVLPLLLLLRRPTHRAYPSATNRNAAAPDS